MTNSVQDDIKSFIAKHSSASERGVALSVFAYLESKIDKCFRAIIRDKEKEDLFLEKTVRSVRSKIEILYCLGIIDKSSFDDLVKINSIRNKFAHNMDINSFQHSSIVSILKNINIQERLEFLGYGKDSQEFTDNFYNGLRYNGEVYVLLCGAYGNKIQTNCHKLSTSNSSVRAVITQIF